MSPEKLKAWRKHHGFTQTEAARWYGVKARSDDDAGRVWRRWENGEEPVPGPLAKRIADERRSHVEA